MMLILANLMRVPVSKNNEAFFKEQCGFFSKFDARFSFKVKKMLLSP